MVSANALYFRGFLCFIFLHCISRFLRVLLLSLSVFAAIQPTADDNADGVAISGQEAAAHAAEQQLLPTKHKMLRVSLRLQCFVLLIQ